MKSQTKKKSLLESVVNTATGFVLSLIIQLLLFPAMGMSVSFGENVLITLVFTIASIARGYVVRRYFNQKLHK